MTSMRMDWSWTETTSGFSRRPHRQRLSVASENKFLN
jgi:hypothetical protein